MSENKTPNKKVKISVITVSFNSEKTIENTIKSVINQTYPYIEYIIIDGKSKDKTTDIIKRYEDNIDYWVSEPDKNHFDAMNKGVKKSTGDYVYFLNSDDSLIDKNSLSLVANELSKSKVDLLYGNIMKRYSKYDLKITNHFSRNNLKKGKMPPHQASFIRKNFFEKIGEHNIEYKSANDFEYMCRMNSNGAVSKYLNETIANFATEGISTNKTVGYKETFSIIKDYFGKYPTYKYFVKNIIIEQGIKKLLISTGMRPIYEKLLKFKNKLSEVKK